jgi:hypothetical protein
MRPTIRPTPADKCTTPDDTASAVAASRSDMSLLANPATPLPALEVPR